MAINLNTADQEELETVLQLDTQQAGEIITYREKNGIIASWDDIRKIPGFSDEVIENLKKNGATVGQSNESEIEDEDEEE